MQALRRFTGLGRLVLLWFALSLGVAVASPLVSPHDMELVCSSTGGVKVLIKTGDGVQEMGSTHLDCPLCAIGGAPAPVDGTVQLANALPLGHVLQSIPAARLAAAVAAPLPARGPPSLS